MTGKYDLTFREFNTHDKLPFETKYKNITFKLKNENVKVLKKNFKSTSTKY